jgi:hypothetical protein
MKARKEIEKMIMKVVREKREKKLKKEGWKVRMIEC